MLEHFSLQDPTFKIPASSLNVSEWKLFPITLIFESGMSVEKWLCQFDFNFKDQLRSILTNCPFLKVCTNYLIRCFFLQQLD